MTGAISGAEIALIITAAGTVLTSVASATAVIIGALNTIKLNRTAAQVEKIEIATNSMKDALVSATASSAHAQGKSEGREEVKTELGATLTIKENP